MKPKLFLWFAVSSLVATIGLVWFSVYFTELTKVLTAAIPVTVPTFSAFGLLISAAVYCLSMSVLFWSFSHEYSSAAIGKVRWLWVAAGVAIFLAGLAAFWGVSSGYAQFNRVAGAATIPQAGEIESAADASGLIVRLGFGFVIVSAVMLLLLGLFGARGRADKNSGNDESGRRRVSIPTMFPMLLTGSSLLFLFLMTGVFLLTTNLQVQFRTPNPALIGKSISLIFQLSVLAMLNLMGTGLLIFSSGFFIKVDVVE